MLPLLKKAILLKIVNIVKKYYKIFFDNMEAMV